MQGNAYVNSVEPPMTPQKQWIMVTSQTQLMITTERQYSRIRPLGQSQGDTRGSMEARAELRLQVLQGSYRSNGCDTKNGNWKL